MNELIDAIVKYFREGLDDAVTSLRDKAIGGIHAHLAPHDSRNPFVVVSCDSPEQAGHTMREAAAAHTHVWEAIVKLSIFTTVAGPDGRDQIAAMIQDVGDLYDDYLFDADPFQMASYRVILATFESRHLFPDPDGGWSGVVLMRYIYGEKAA